MPHGLLELRLDRGSLLGVSLFLRLKGVFHLPDILVQAAREGTHRVFRFFSQGLFAGLEQFLVLEGQFGPGSVQRLLVAGFQLLERFLVESRLVLAHRALGAQARVRLGKFRLLGEQLLAETCAHNEMGQQPRQERGHGGSYEDNRV